MPPLSNVTYMCSVKPCVNIYLNQSSSLSIDMGMGVSDK